MKNLIGNTIVVFLKGTDKNIEGLLIEVDEKFDYLQRENSVCIVPIQNVLYYETNQFSRTPKIINAMELSATKEKSLIVFVDKEIVAEVKVPEDLENKELIRFLYSVQTIRESLRGKKQKSLECRENSVYIVTDQCQEENTNIDSQDEFKMELNGPVNSYLSPADMVKRLNNAVGGKKNGRV